MYEEINYLMHLYSDIYSYYNFFEIFFQKK